MRPGQTAPECAFLVALLVDCSFRFNEAGADCPGMPLTRRSGLGAAVAASMRPGQTAPECTCVDLTKDINTWMLQ